MKNEKFVATFGSGQLSEYELQINPIKVMLVSPDGFNENQFRNMLRQRFNNKYCTTYSYKYAKVLQKKYGLVEYTFEQLEKLKRKI